MPLLSVTDRHYVLSLGRRQTGAEILRGEADIVTSRFGERQQAVGSRAGAVDVGKGSSCCRQLSPSAGASVLTMSPFPAPSSSHAACRFPALRAPAHFASRVMGPVAFALTYILRLSSCRLTDEFIGSSLPRFVERRVVCSRAPLLRGRYPAQRYYGPSRHRLVFSRFPGGAGYTTYLAPDITAWDEDGFSSCLACSCHRAVPTTPPEGYASLVSLRYILLPSSDSRRLGL